MRLCGKIELMRKNLNMQEQYKISEGNNQLVLVLNSEIILPEDAPVRVTRAQLEELDYRKLNEVYSSKGRKWITDSNHQTKSSNGRRKGQKKAPAVHQWWWW